jgi:hypothetical protein
MAVSDVREKMAGMQSHANTFQRIYLKHLDVHTGLIVNFGGEDLALACGNNSVALHHIRHNAS